MRYLTSVLGAASPDEIPEDWADSTKLEHEARSVLDDEPEAPALEELGNVFVVIAEFRAEYWTPHAVEQMTKGTAVDPENEEAVPDIGIFAVFELDYTLDSTVGLTADDLRAFARMNAVFNVWPYWRELAHSTTVRMGLANPLLVPVLTVNALAAGD